ncbi:peptidase S8/S53 domain-containing protein [Tribonema minus]|uniref:subtilisin n=1 Tax=Tribonema minus TaxID=303371 RepID=A0A835YSW5_9STRA|nr:peptidase S8/S53 domain-containing protein [Tribonema minus]
MRRLAAAAAIIAGVALSAATDVPPSRRLRRKRNSYSVLLYSHAAGSVGSVGIAAMTDATQAAAQALDAIYGVNVRSAIPEIGVVFISGPPNSAAIIKRRVGQRVKAVLPTMVFSSPVVRPVPSSFINGTGSGASLVSSEGSRDGNPGRTLSVVDEPDYRPLQWSRVAMDADRAFNAGLKGGGKRPARVAVIDEGFWLDHPSIAHYNKELSFNFVPGEELMFNPKRSSDRDLSHGTHTSSILAGRDLSGHGTLGIAPEADLVLLKGLSDGGYGEDLGVMTAIKYAVEKGVDIISLSLGGVVDRRGQEDDPYTDYDESLTPEEAAAYIDMWTAITGYAYRKATTICRLADCAGCKLAKANTHPPHPPPPNPPKLDLKGVTIIASAGNDRADLDKTNPNKVYILADLPHVIAVSATGPIFWGRDQATNLDRFVTGYSNYGAPIDLAAPGGNIAAAYRDFNATCRVPLGEGRAALELRCYEFDAVLSACCSASATFPRAQYRRATRYAWLAGTSMAAPHAAGVAALIVAKRGARVAPDKLFAYLQQCADDRGLAGKDRRFGYGRVSAGKVVDLVF